MDWFDRATQERDELLDKVTKLKDFIGSDEYNNLNKFDQEDLNIQLHAMEIYLMSLERRIEREHNRRNAVKTLG